MQNPIQDIENFLFKVMEMRQKQREFFKTGNNVVKRRAIELEKEVDALTHQLLKKGYKPTDTKASQRSIF